jgi:hypothetical protein
MKNKIIDFFFEDMEQYEAYKPYIFLLAAVGVFSLLASLLSF